MNAFPRKSASSDRAALNRGVGKAVRRGFRPALWMLAATLGCGGTANAVAPSIIVEPPVAAELVGIAVTPGQPSMQRGLSRQFTATGSYSDRTTKNLTQQVAWAVLPNGVVSVSNDAGSAGFARALATGTATLAATLSGVSGATTLTVTQGGRTLSAITVVPGTPWLAAGEPQQFTATGTYSDHSTANLSTQTLWSSSVGAVATISNAAGSSGMAHGVAPGNTTIGAAFGGITGSTVLAIISPPTVAMRPEDPLIEYSDRYSLALSGALASFARPVLDVHGFNLVAPGARVRFRTAAPYMVIHLSYSNDIIPSQDWRPQGAVLVDGSVYTTFEQGLVVAGAPARPVSIELAFGTTRSRTIEVVMPYCASVAFLGVNIDHGSVLTLVPPRPSETLLALGDSITQGFEASGVADTWAFLLTQAKGWQLVNGGYGGRTVVPADAALLAPRADSQVAITYLIGYNDFWTQQPLAAFKADYIAYITALRAAHPSAVIYCITPLWTSRTAESYGGTIEIERYRQQIRAAVAELGNPLDVLVEGESLVTNSSAYFLDGIHPNDAGSAQMATALGAVMNPIMPP